MNFSGTGLVWVVLIALPSGFMADLLAAACLLKVNTDRSTNHTYGNFQQESDCPNNHCVTCQWRK